MHGTVDEEKGADEDRQHDVVEHPDIVQVEHGKKLSPRHRLNAVFAVSERRLQTEEVHHLREREGDHGEVDALATDRQQTRDQPQQRRRRGPERDRGLGWQAPDFRGVRAHIARHAEEHRVAEGQQPAEPDQEIERAGE